MRFTRPWIRPSNAGPHIPLVPAISVWLLGASREARQETFLIDSGADMSMGSRRLCERLGYSWESGDAIMLDGISPKPECSVPARIHKVEVFIPEIGGALRIPICFADGDATQLFGREGFFDCFRITLDMWNQETVFEFPDEED